MLLRASDVRGGAIHCCSLFEKARAGIIHSSPRNIDRRVIVAEAESAQRGEYSPDYNNGIGLSVIRLLHYPLLKVPIIRQPC